MYMKNDETNFILTCFFDMFHFTFYVKKKKKKKERKEERDIKYNEKDTFIPIFNNEKGKVGCGCLTEGISIGDLSDNF